MSDELRVSGARVHNLKNVSLAIPRKKLVVFTGPSGSGKSSLAFDTIYAEGQRRYVESLSVYARQFIGQLEKADVDRIDGLAPTISIEQKSSTTNPRSTVGTITEVYDYLRVFYANVGRQHCHICGSQVGAADVATVLDAITALPEGTKIQILAPLVVNRKGEFRDLFEKLRRSGFTRARVDNAFLRLDEVEKLKKNFKHNIDVVVDRLVVKPGIEDRLATAVERALEEGERQLRVVYDSGPREGEEDFFSQTAWCPNDEISFPPLTHQSFSFNSPMGRCRACNGLGTELSMDPEKVVPDHSRSINKGAFAPLKYNKSRAIRWFIRVMEAVCDHYEINRRAAWSDLSEEHRYIVLNGPGEELTLKVKGRTRPTRVRFEGVLGWTLSRYEEATSEGWKTFYGSFLSSADCSACDGTRLRRESRAVQIGGYGIDQISGMTVAEASEVFRELRLDGRDATLGNELLSEVRARLSFLVDVGLSYLSLNRSGPTLSGGEAQRIRLAGQLGAGLCGVLYVLDEPSIGLHQRDNRQLITTLEQLRDAGNTVLIVEHDRDTIDAADFVVDFGPGAGTHGGEVTFQGPPAKLADAKGNVTADYMVGRRSIEVPATRRSGSGHSLTVRNARANNLRGLDIAFPLGTFCCVTGVSGAGKSTLVNDILFPAVAGVLYPGEHPIAPCDGVDGVERVDKVIRIDQRPIGRTPRSNPATYTKVFDLIRAFFAKLPEAQMYGYKPGRFSFNVAGGRCEECSGAGVKRIEMMFLADVFVTCDVCRGRRFNDATLRVRYRGHSIVDVLEMPIEEATELFSAHPKIRRALQTMVDVGLGYITLGQPSPTLSGGEAQRIKLSRELRKVATGDTLYVLDEPSTGLHFDDIRKLLAVVDTLVEAGNTVVMIEHNLDIIKVADHVIDMGPEGGEQGGTIVASGTPEDVALIDASHTGRYLREELRASAAASR